MAEETAMAESHAEKIKAAREDAGMSQYDLADELGCSQSRVAKWENGHHEVSNAYRRLLEQVLDISFED